MRNSVFLAICLCAAHPLSAQFLAKPYLQLGDHPKPGAPESLVLMWHTDSTDRSWTVQVRVAGRTAWRVAEPPTSVVVSAPAGEPVVAGVNGAARDAPASPAIPPHRVYHARLRDLTPGREFSYRVLLDGKPVFEAAGRARKPSGRPYRFVVFGDCAQGTPASRTIAHRAYLAQPDFIVIPGDIVYGAGRISEYRTRFFPVYNADEPSPDGGAPLARSVPLIAAPGNHDIALNHRARYPDALAFFLYWDQPLNGPALGIDKTTHVLTGIQAGRPEFLAAAKNAAFRFVAFHHPGFNSSKAHFPEQWMRQLAPVFEAHRVDIVFAGHVHNYQRSFPMTFAPRPLPDDKLVGPKGEVDGLWQLDKEFGDGAAKKPHGVIYIVTGAGGAGLYNPEQQPDPASWQPFTDKFFSQTHSITVADVSGKTLRVRQVSAAGEDLDAFQIAK